MKLVFFWWQSSSNHTALYTFALRSLTQLPQCRTCEIILFVRRGSSLRFKLQFLLVSVALDWHVVSWQKVEGREETLEIQAFVTSEGLLIQCWQKLVLSSLRCFVPSCFMCVDVLSLRLRCECDCYMYSQFKMNSMPKSLCKGYMSSFEGIVFSYSYRVHFCQ